MLPIDADDKLLPDALERMLTRLETAPEDIGFVYPHAQHFGNRTDFMRLAAYNLWLLMQENFIPAPCLFDRRVFGVGGVEYPEDIVIGHEDWDLILQLAERGVHGLHADGPTFLYRRRGFSRINSVEYGQDPFHETIERRHAPLYGNRDAIKARWSPALSIVLFEEGDGSGWSDEDLSDLPRQTCSDFELVANAKLAGGVRVVDEPAGVPETWLQEAIDRGLGRRARRDAGGGADPAQPRIRRATPLRRCRTRGGFRDRPRPARPRSSATRSPSSTTASGSRRTRRHRVRAPLRDPPAPDRPRKPAIGPRRPGHGDAAEGERIQWRVVPVTEGADLSEPSPRDGTRPKRLDINHGRTGDRSEIAMRDAVGSSRRGCRRRSPRYGAGRIRALRRPPKPNCCTATQSAMGFAEPSPTTDNLRRATSWSSSWSSAEDAAWCPAPGLLGELFELSDNQNELDAGARGLGYLQQRRCRARATGVAHDAGDWPGGSGRRPRGPSQRGGQAAGDHGPALGYLIRPRRSILHTGPWGVVTLFRQAYGYDRRHRYAASSSRMPDAVELGLLHSRPQAEFVALLLRDDGHLATDLTRPGRASRDPRKVVRWVAGPLKEARGRRRPSRRGRHRGRGFATSSGSATVAG